MDYSVILKWLLESGIYSIFGILIIVVSYLLIDKCTKFSLKKELIEDENIALGTMFAGFFIALAIIIAAAIK